MDKKPIEIEDLFFKDFNKMFSDSLVEGLKEVDLEDEEVLKKLSKAFEQIYSSYEDHISSFYLERHKFQIEDFLSRSHANQKEIIERNKESFVHFILYINTCVIIYEKILDYLQNDNEGSLSNTLKINISLYGLSIRRAQQIVDLLISGQVDGAMIIWRSLYENAVCLLTLAINNNDELTERFVEHAFRNSRRKVNSYDLNYEELKFRPLPPETFEYLDKERMRLVEKYGKEFISNDYGWADILFSGRANFRLLEDEIELNRFRPYYTLCSEQIHSSFNGFGRFSEKNSIIVPRFLSEEFELEDFVDPMQFTVGILHEMNDYIIWELSTEEELKANLLFLKKMFEKLIDSFEFRDGS